MQETKHQNMDTTYNYGNIILLLSLDFSSSVMTEYKIHF